MPANLAEPVGTFVTRLHYASVAHRPRRCVVAQGLEVSRKKSFTQDCDVLTSALCDRAEHRDRLVDNPFASLICHMSTGGGDFSLKQFIGPSDP